MKQPLPRPKWPSALLRGVLVLLVALVWSCQPSPSTSGASATASPGLPPSPTLTPSLRSSSPIAKLLRLVSDPWPGYIDEEGGYLVTLAQEIFEPEGYRVVVQTMPFARALNEVQTGEADMAPALYRNTASHLLYAEQPTAIDATAIIVNEHFKISADNLSALSGQQVGWVREFHFAPILQQKFHLTVESYQVNSRENGLTMLKNGRLAAFIDNEQVLRTLAHTLNLTDPPFKIVTAFRKGLYFGFTDSPHGQLLKEIFDRELSRLTRSGELAELYHRMIKDGPEL